MAVDDQGLAKAADRDAAGVLLHSSLLLTGIDVAHMAERRFRADREVLANVGEQFFILAALSTKYYRAQLAISKPGEGFLHIVGIERTLVAVHDRPTLGIIGKHRVEIETVDEQHFLGRDDRLDPFAEIVLRGKIDLLPVIRLVEEGAYGKREADGEENRADRKSTRLNS